MCRVPLPHASEQCSHFSGIERYHLLVSSSGTSNLQHGLANITLPATVIRMILFLGKDTYYLSDYHPAFAFYPMEMWTTSALGGNRGSVR